MREEDRLDRWLVDLRSALVTAEDLVARGRPAYDGDIAVRLAFEALAVRVGEIAKRLVAADSDRFADPLWSQAARNRDFVVHHYDRVDVDALWSTLAVSFPELRALIAA